MTVHVRARAEAPYLVAVVILLLTGAVVANAEQEGKVTAVKGKRVTVQFSEHASPQAGATLRIGSSVPGIGFVPVDGAWKVKNVDGGTASAEPVGTVGVPSPGMLVQVASEGTQASTSETPRKTAPKGPANKATRALRAAIVTKDTDKVKELLAAGADADYAETGDHTMLMAACRWGKPEIVQLLLQAGADPNVAVTDGNSYEVVGKTALIFAVAARQTDSVKHLLKAGANVNAKNVNYDETALHFAAAAGDAVAVQALLDAGAGVNAATKQPNGGSGNKRALHEAAEGGNSDVVATLINAGAEVNQKMTGSKAGVTPLWNAAQFGHLEAAKHLLEAGADPDVQVTGDFAPDWKGYTPLHAAVKQKHPKVVKALIHAGADATIHNARGETALDLAKRMKNDEMIEIIRTTLPVKGGQSK